MSYNSPYDCCDVRVIHQAASRYQDQFRSQRDWIVVCRMCFYGVHPHGDDKYSDCKVLLIDENGNFTKSQCCCTWRENYDNL